MKYAYYDSGNNNQVMALFDTPKLADQPGWAGLQRAIVPDGMDVTRNHRITEVDGDSIIVSVSASANSLQPELSAEEEAQIALRTSGKAKLVGLGLTDDEINSLISR